MAQNMMAQNPALAARAQRMMQDPDAMQRAMAKMGNQDPNTMTAMMEKMSSMNAASSPGQQANAPSANTEAQNKESEAALDKLIEELDDLEFEEEVQASKTVKDPSYEHLGKRITNLMLEFDKVDVTGNEPLKMKRKAAIKRIQILGEKAAE